MIKTIITMALLLVALMNQLLAQSEIETAFYNGNYEKVLQLVVDKQNAGTVTESDYFIAAQSHAVMFDYENAIIYYQAALQINPGNHSARESLADASINMGQKENAMASYDRILEATPSNARILGKKATLLSDMNRYDEAGKIYRYLLDSYDHNPFFYRRLMIALHKQRNYNEIIKTHEAEPSFASTDKEVKMVVADAYNKNGDNIQAMELLTYILQIDSLYTPALSRAGLIHYTVYRNYEAAVVYYRKLNMVNNYSDPTQLKNLSICEYFTGNYEYAAVTLDSLSFEVIDDPLIPFYAGLSYRKIGNLDRAILYLEIATDMLSMPSFTSDFYHHLGRAYSAKRMYPEALSAYEMVLEHNDKNTQVLYDIAITHEEYNRNQTVALGYYQQFIRRMAGNNSPDLRYAENRVKRIKEELFME
jgi:tetratricopeptide (TPR) repeat protein